MHICLIAAERVAPAMAAAGIRTTEMARALGDRHRVTVAAPTGSSPPGGLDGIGIYDPGDPGSLAAVVGDADVVFSQPLPPRLMSRAVRGRAWVVDLINPQVVEGLEYHKGRRRLERKGLEMVRIDRLGWAARTGTSFVCGSERQRDLWLGFLAAERRLDTDLYALDAQMRALIDLAPSGVPAERPVPPREPVLRGPVFASDAKIVAWNGGLWDWLDPFTVLDALALLRAGDPRWGVAFAGAKRPSHRPAMEMAERVKEHAARIGVTDAVHMTDGWTPYARRADVLLEADVVVSAHRSTLEARFSYRNRVLDALWAGTPVVCSSGDAIAEEVAAHGWGEAVPPGEADTMAGALERVVSGGREQYGAALAAAAANRTWEKAAMALEGVLERACASGARRGGPLAAGMRLRHGIASRVRSA